MTKAQLIKRLEKYPDDMMIVVSGYEGDFDDPIIRICEINKGYNSPKSEDYRIYGQHLDKQTALNNELKTLKFIKVIGILRKNT